MKGYRRTKKAKTKGNSRSETFITSFVFLLLSGGIVCWISFAFAHQELLSEKLVETRNLLVQQDSLLREEHNKLEKEHFLWTEQHYKMSVNKNDALYKEWEDKYTEMIVRHTAIVHMLQ